MATDGNSVGPAVVRALNGANVCPATVGACVVGALLGTSVGTAVGALIGCCLVLL